MTKTVHASGNLYVDLDNVQKAIDAAGDGEVVELLGAFNFRDIIKVRDASIGFGEAVIQGGGGPGEENKA